MLGRTTHQRKWGGRKGEQLILYVYFMNVKRDNRLTMQEALLTKCRYNFHTIMFTFVVYEHNYMHMKTHVAKSMSLQKHHTSIKLVTLIVTKVKFFR